MTTLHVAKGRKTSCVDLSQDRPDDDALASMMLGPTGNLRAPTMRSGREMFVGFSPELYEQLLG